ncbi:MAG: hypothetical protein NZ822_02830 [Patescibacteria group bacterium]|nr:hypothetical protein [Patescibacteria group bacterium]
MINFLIGFLVADILFSFLILFEKSIIFNLKEKHIILAIIIDLILLSFIVLYFINEKRKKVRKN